MSKNFLQTGLSAAVKAGEIVKSYYGKDLDVAFKRSKEDLVTEADFEVEKKIKEIIQHNFPEHFILGEETNITAGKSDYVWIIDPIDGTSNFVKKIPYFAISIGLLKGAKPILGIVYNPITNELYSAFEGVAYFNGKKISANSKADLKDSVIFVSENHDKPLKDELKSLISKINTKVEFKSTALALCQTAAGVSDAFFKLSTKSWDVIAGHYIAECAGCKVTDTLGNNLEYDYKIERNPKGILVANPKLHKELLKILRTQRTIP
ncbi:MAG: inositol monophosphatase family protein [Nanoarchaeota archaeon]